MQEPEIEIGSVLPETSSASLNFSSEVDKENVDNGNFLPKKFSPVFTRKSLYSLGVLLLLLAVLPAALVLTQMRQDTRRLAMETPISYPTTPTSTPTKPPLTPVPTVTPATHTPMISTTSMPAATSNKYYQTHVVATDTGKDLSHVIVSTLPSGLRRNCVLSSNRSKMTCTIYGTPTKKGAFNLNFKFTDAGGRSVSKTFSFVIR